MNFGHTLSFHLADNLIFQNKNISRAVQKKIKHWCQKERKEKWNIYPFHPFSVTPYPYLGQGGLDKSPAHHKADTWDKQPFTHRFTPTFRVTSYPACLHTVKVSRVPGENTHRHGENMWTPHRKAPKALHWWYPIMIWKHHCYYHINVTILPFLNLNIALIFYC